MRRLLSAILLLLGHSSAAAAPREKATPPAVPDKADFTARLHGELMSKKGNLFYSPASIRMAMAMAQAGAVGETAEEMKKVLGLDGDSAAMMAKLRADWQALGDPKLPSWASDSNDPQTQKYAEAELERRRIVLRVVNRLWGQQGRSFKDAFLATLRDRYGAPLEQLDFKSAAEASRVAINKWVSDQTEKKIDELIPAGAIPNETKLIITNAVYFKGQWSKQFETRLTKPEVFHTQDGGKQVPMMRQLDRFRVAHIDGGLMLEMPYGEGALAMDVVLPSARDGLPALEKRFAAGALEPWLAKLETRRVDVVLPAFKTRASLELAKVLEAMGMKRAFKFPDADFSAMDGTHELFISRVIHQAFLAVDEKGTEAAAATAVMMEAGAAPPTDEPVKFRVDHPFMLIIRDTRNGEALFVGRVLDPKA